MLKDKLKAWGDQLVRALETRALSLLARLADRPRSHRRVMEIAMDAILCAVAAILALALRIGEWAEWDRSLALLITICMALWFPIASALNVYSSLIRFSGSKSIFGLGIAALLYTVPMMVIFMLVSISGIPRTMAILHPIVFLALLCTSRLFIRFALVDMLHKGERPRRRRIGIYGAGRAGQQLALALRHEPQMKLVAFFDDNEKLSGEMIDTVRIYPAIRYETIIADLEIDEVVLAIPSISRTRRREIVEKLSSHRIVVRSLPTVGNLIDGKVTINDLREVQIEELLGRDQVAPNELLLAKNTADKVVLVTGAGGSIGSELCRQILACRPAKLILLEQSELALYQIENELSVLAKGLGLATLFSAELCDVADLASVERVFKRYMPSTIYHAAAYKHVPLVEANPVSGLRNNVFGTLNCALVAEQIGVSRFILISTDKAVRPPNVMGASKRICEMVLQARAQLDPATIFSMVRFGNVLGSSGSVVPLFRQQIRAGGPITLTDRRVTRYFMTIPEAAQLVIQAGALANGGEVYVLDMGQPVRVFDLAVAMVRLCGLTVRDEESPDGDIEIKEIGLRPGEKLYEELLIGNDPLPTKHERIVLAYESMVPWDELRLLLDQLRQALERGDGEDALRLTGLLVPEYAAANSRAAGLHAARSA